MKRSIMRIFVYHSKNLEKNNIMVENESLRDNRPALCAHY